MQYTSAGTAAVNSSGGFHVSTAGAGVVGPEVVGGGGGLGLGGGGGGAGAGTVTLSTASMLAAPSLVQPGTLTSPSTATSTPITVSTFTPAQVYSTSMKFSIVSGKKSCTLSSLNVIFY